jgi:Flp pilus assembly protein TadG
MTSSEELKGQAGTSEVRSQRLLRSIDQSLRLVALRGRNRRIAQEEDGSSLIEFAIVSSGMILFVLVLMQLCIALYSYGMITEVARDTTRWAATRGSTCETYSSTSCTATAATITSYAKGLGYPNIGGGTMSVTPTFPAGNQSPGSTVKVAITYTVPVTLPLVPKHSISLQTSSVMTILQ